MAIRLVSVRTLLAIAKSFAEFPVNNGTPAAPVIVSPICKIPFTKSLIPIAKSDIS